MHDRLMQVATDRRGDGRRAVQRALMSPSRSPQLKGMSCLPPFKKWIAVSSSHWKTCMALRIRVSARAEAQIHKLDQWRAVHRLAAPDAVLHDVHAALSLLAQQPGIGTLTSHPPPD